MIMEVVINLSFERIVEIGPSIEVGPLEIVPLVVRVFECPFGEPGRKGIAYDMFAQWLVLRAKRTKTKQSSVSECRR